MRIAELPSSESFATTNATYDVVWKTEDNFILGDLDNFTHPKQLFPKDAVASEFTPIHRRLWNEI